MGIHRPDFAINVIYPPQAQFLKYTDKNLDIYYGAGEGLSKMFINHPQRSFYGAFVLLITLIDSLPNFIKLSTSVTFILRCKTGINSQKTNHSKED